MAGRISVYIEFLCWFESHALRLDGRCQWVTAGVNPLLWPLAMARLRRVAVDSR